MIKKKFRVRVSYYAQGRYTVDYAYYRFIPNWRSLHFWFEQTLTGGTQCWSPEFFSVKEAESLAQQIKSIEDVNKWYLPHEKKRENFYMRQAEYYKNNVPYNKKEF